jgi:hypothetical protein
MGGAAWLPIVNPAEGRLLAECGMTEGVNFLVTRPLPDIEVRPETVARMAQMARGGVGASLDGDFVPLPLANGRV